MITNTDVSTDPELYSLIFSQINEDIRIDGICNFSGASQSITVSRAEFQKMIEAFNKGEITQ